MVNPSGTWTYYYDDAGRYTSMSSPLGTVSSTYDDAGRQLTRTLPNGAYTTVTYNEVGTPTSWINKNSGGTKLSEWGSFAYDGVFNLTETTASNHIASSQFDGYLNFDYTAKDQLAEEDSSRFNGYTETNVWDGASNPTTFRSNSGRTYNGSNQRSNTGYAYDGNGNPTTYAGTTCTYDVENRLTAFGSSNANVFTYRADGLRATENTGTDKTYYLYDGGNAVCRLDSSGNVNRTYVFAPDGLVGWTGSGTRYFLFDWQGNLEHSMESSTTLKASYAFNAWGQRNSIFPINAESSSNDRFGYNARWGYVKDLGTGMYYCQNRYYDPANGRWLTRDPIGFSGGMNVYGYCGGGPVGAADPSGLMQLPRRLILELLELHADIQGLSGPSPSQKLPEILGRPQTAYSAPAGASGAPRAKTLAELISAGNKARESAKATIEAMKSVVPVSDLIGDCKPALWSRLGRDLGNTGALGAIITLIVGADAGFQGVAAIAKYRKRINGVYAGMHYDGDDDLDPSLPSFGAEPDPIVSVPGGGGGL